MTTRELSALPPAKSRFIEPMYARLVNTLPEGSEWLYEVKFDGYRCPAGKDTSSVTLWSRRENLFTEQFPSIARACKRLPSETLIDGEIVAVDENGRISFKLLQHHRSKAQALLFYVFDVVIYRGRSLLKEPLTARREILREVVSGLGKAGPVVCPKRSRAMRRILFVSQKSLASRGSWPSGRTPVTSQANAAERGASTDCCVTFVPVRIGVTAANQPTARSPANLGHEPSS
jgi:ATP-dependent DNA ligase